MFPRSLYYALLGSIITHFLFHYYAFSYLLLRRFEFIIRRNRARLLEVFVFVFSIEYD